MPIETGLPLCSLRHELRQTRATKVPLAAQVNRAASTLMDEGFHVPFDLHPRGENRRKDRSTLQDVAERKSIELSFSNKSNASRGIKPEFPEFCYRGRNHETVRGQ